MKRSGNCGTHLLLQHLGDRDRWISEFKAILGHGRLFQSKGETDSVIAHSFNHSICELHAFSSSSWKVETGVIWLTEERNIRQEKIAAQGIPSEDL